MSEAVHCEERKLQSMGKRWRGGETALAQGEEVGGCEGTCRKAEGKRQRKGKPRLGIVPKSDESELMMGQSCRNKPKIPTS